MTGLNDVAGISVICQQNQTKFNEFKINNVGKRLMILNRINFLYFYIVLQCFIKYIYNWFKSSKVIGIRTDFWELFQTVTTFLN